MISRIFSLLIYLITSGLGVVAFLYPFWQPMVTQSAMPTQSRATDSMLLMTLLVALCFAVLLLELQRQTVNTKTVALLGMLVAVNATLRFAETALPGPGGYSPIFLLIILTGYVYGGRFGFLMGALTLFVSAIITGGVGPWLPYQMFTVGWVGMTAPLCRGIVTLFSSSSKQAPNSRVELFTLALFGGVWGLLYGAIINLWFWPFATGDPTQYWTPGIGIGELVERYALFYLVTSFVWDLIRAIGNVVMIYLLGEPILRGLRRFQDRFEYHYQPLLAEATLGPKIAKEERV